MNAPSVGINRETQRAKEHFYRSILDCMPQRLFWKDCNSVFRGCNLSGAHALNLSGTGAIAGKTDYDFSLATMPNICASKMSMS